MKMEVLKKRKAISVRKNDLKVFIKNRKLKHLKNSA